jgi:hypothetical protein
MMKCGNWRRLPGGGGLKRPKHQLRCSAEEEEEEEEEEERRRRLCRVLSNKVFLPKANVL